MTDRRTLRWPSRIVRHLDDHPVVLVAVVALAFVVFQWWWIANARFLGALDTDEGASVATSLSFHRALATGPVDLVRAALGTGSGPLVPLLSIPFIAVFGRSGVSPMFVQPVLVMLSAIGAAGSVYQLVGRRAAVVAGCCTLAMPALVTSSRTDQFSNGVGAAMCLAIWALLASDRARKPWPVLAFGVACGAMTISRTMSVSFIPAMLAAAFAFSAVREGRVRRNLVLGMIAALVVAIPWWWAQWDYVSAYLLSSGYGSRSGFYGQEMITSRVVQHIGYLLREFRVFLPMGVFLAVLSGIKGVRGVLLDRRAWMAANRGLVSVWIAVAVGTTALLSSSNRGYWFATPLDSLLVVGVVAAGTRLVHSEERVRINDVVVAAVVATVVMLVGWAVTGIGVVVGSVVLAVAAVVLIRGGSRRGLWLGTLALGVSAGAIAASIPFVGPSASVADSSLRGQLAGGLEAYLPTVHEADARLSSTNISTRKRVAREWWEAARRLDHELLLLEDSMSVGGNGTLAEVVTGSRGLFESNTVAVARELGPRGVRWLTDPNTFEVDDEEILKSITPRTQDGTPRVIVVIEGRAPPFPNSLGWHRLARLATQRGWVVHSTIPLPDRGRVVIYIHPSNVDED